MKLSSWLETAGLNQSELARELGITQGRVSQLIAGGKPSLDLAARIQSITANKVRLADFVDCPGDTRPCPGNAAFRRCRRRDRGHGARRNGDRRR